MKYDLVLVDFPWRYKDEKKNDPAMGGITYPTMSDEEIASLPITDIMQKDSLMLCWITMPKMPEAMDIIREFKLTPVTCLLVWIKLNKSGTVEYDGRDVILRNGLYSGLGHYANGNAELLWVCKRGKGLQRHERSVKQLMFSEQTDYMDGITMQPPILSPIGAHSRKPFEQYERIERLFGKEIKRLELFARPPVADGWDATGFDFDGRHVREFIEGNK